MEQVVLANSPERAEHILILDLPGLFEAAKASAKQVSIWCDDVRDRAHVPADHLLKSLDAASLAGIDLVWMRLPRALGALDEYSELLSHVISEGGAVVAAGRNKDLNRSMNKTLERHFGQVSASLGLGKARALLACAPLRSSITWPRHKTVEAAGHEIDLWWHGATFAAGRIDAGTKLMIDHLDQVPTSQDTYLDLGCGSGILTALLARVNPQSQVFGVDASWAAVDAARRTLSSPAPAANADNHTNANTQALHAADLSAFTDNSLDVIVCNPPFHQGSAKESAPTIAMFNEAARALKPGGQFFCVYNSHLPWKARLSSIVGPTTLIAQNRSYTLVRATKEAALGN
ncbi:MAG: methyltransferase [Actinomycetaceae bacterium]|nr:methyltransferase [Actinomycetaceae bacterium]